MPEGREDLAHKLLAILLCSILGVFNMAVVRLWADPATKDSAAFKKKANDHVRVLNATDGVKRGSKNGQTPLYPEFCKPGARNYVEMGKMRLKGIFSTGRAMVIDFGVCFFMLAWLTHTSIQLYSLDRWHASIAEVPTSMREFKVALGIEFKYFVLAFLSIDLMVQPHWRIRREDLPTPPPDIYGNFKGFLDDLVDCLRARRESSAKNNGSKRNGLAIHWLRDQKTVWCGVGVYSVLEIFFIAGISPFLTEKEVFDNPSRVARLCFAFYCFMAYAHEHLPDLLRPCIHDNVLSPTLEQRARYADWLYVWAKLETIMSLRAAKLRDDYCRILQELGSNTSEWVRDSVLSDVFEPMLLTSAYEAAESGLIADLTALIYGNDQRASLFSFPSSTDDVLTTFFRDEGLLDTPTRLTSYDTLFDPFERMNKGEYKRRPTFSYRCYKAIWSITPPFPSNSLPEFSAGVIENMEEVSGEARKKAEFKTKITTNGVEVGPTEWNGNGEPVRNTNGEIIVSLCRADPAVPAHLALRALKSHKRRAEGLNKPGASHQTMSKKQRLDVSKYPTIAKVLEERDQNRVEVPPKEKSRFSFDLKMAGFDPKIKAEDDGSKAPAKRARNVVKYTR